MYVLPFYRLGRQKQLLTQCWLTTGVQSTPLRRFSRLASGRGDWATHQIHQTRDKRGCLQINICSTSPTANQAKAFRPRRQTLSCRQDGIQMVHMLHIMVLILNASFPHQSKMNVMFLFHPAVLLPSVIDRRCITELVKTDIKCSVESTLQSKYPIMFGKCGAKPLK